MQTSGHCTICIDIYIYIPHKLFRLVRKKNDSRNIRAVTSCTKKNKSVELTFLRMTDGHSQRDWRSTKGRGGSDPSRSAATRRVQASQSRESWPRHASLAMTPSNIAVHLGPTSAEINGPRFCMLGLWWRLVGQMTCRRRHVDVIQNSTWPNSKSSRWRVSHEQGNIEHGPSSISKPQFWISKLSGWGTRKISHASESIAWMSFD